MAIREARTTTDLKLRVLDRNKKILKLISAGSRLIYKFKFITTN